MKLNVDCVRDILLEIEQVCVVGRHACFRFDNSPLLPQCAYIDMWKKYPADEIEYHLRQCDLAGLLFKCDRRIGITTICDLSPKGHEFIANIRKGSIWSKIKSVGRTLGISSLSGITQIAAAVTTEVIKSYFNLP